MKISGVFAVNGGAFREIDIDLSDPSPEEAADALGGEADGISLCHQCAGEIDDPELGELTYLRFGGAEYELTDEGWRRIE